MRASSILHASTDRQVHLLLKIDGVPSTQINRSGKRQIFCQAGPIPRTLRIPSPIFLRTGFRGGLNYYRSIQLGFDLAAPFKGKRVEQPSFFLVGETDGLNQIASPTTENLRRSLPGLIGHIKLPGVGHWPQREAAAETDAVLLDFLRQVN